MVKRKISTIHEDSNARTESTTCLTLPTENDQQETIGVVKTNDIYSRVSVTATHGRGSLTGWTSCPLCNHTSQKKYALGRGITMHLDQVHTPWRPGKAEIIRRERVRRRIQKYVHQHHTFAKKNEKPGRDGGDLCYPKEVVSEDDILSNIPQVESSETQEEYRNRLLKHYLGENIWDRDGKTRQIFYEPTKEEEVQWSHRLLELARKVEVNHVNKGPYSTLNHHHDKNESKAKTETDFIEAGYDRNGKKSKSYKESLPPFIKAASEGNIDLLKTMVEDAKAMSQVEELLDTRDRNGSTAEHWAAGNGHLGCLQYLFSLSAKYDCNKTPSSTSDDSTKRRRKRDGKTCLHYAARNGHTCIIQYLLDLNSSADKSHNHNHVDVESGDGTTPLHLACYGGHLNTIQHLIERGADLYKTNEWDCGIGHWIAMSIQQQDSEELVSILNYIKTVVKDGDLFDIFGRAQKQGHTSVHKAAQKLNRKFIEWLVREVKNKNIWTVQQIEEAGRSDVGGHKPSDIWLQMGGNKEFHDWMKDQCGW